MNIRSIFVAVMLAVSTAVVPATISSISSSAYAAESSFVGTWTGKTAKGGAIRIVVPKSGNPSYTFRGSRVPVTAATMSGKALVLSLRGGEGTVTLTPKGEGKLGYSYRYNQDKASATLTKS